MQQMSMCSGQGRKNQPMAGHLTRKKRFVFKAFPDNRVGNRPYKIFSGQGDYTCSVAEFTGTFTGTMTSPDGTVIPPTGEKFSVEFCTVSLWKDGEIVEEKLFYDKMSLMQQVGLM